MFKCYIFTYSSYVKQETRVPVNTAEQLAVNTTQTHINRMIIKMQEVTANVTRKSR